MLKLTKNQAEILDKLLRMESKKVAQVMKVSPDTVYGVLYNFKRKVQNAEEFLAVARSKYAPLLKKRLNTPRIMPVDEEEEW